MTKTKTSKGDLTTTELEDIKAEAELEAEAELKAAKKAALKAQFKEAAKQEYLVQEGTEEGEATSEITIDLPDSCPNLKTNGKVYRHGHTYYLTAKVKADIISRVAKAWEHHKETREGKSALYFSQPRRRKN